MTRENTGAPLRWTAWLLYALSAFQLVVAVLLVLNWTRTVTSFTGRAFAPSRSAAEGAAAGALVVHVLLAAVFLLLAWKILNGRRWSQVLATILLGYTVVGGMVTLFTIAADTPLNPIGIALAAAALALLWLPRSSRTHFTG